MGRQEEVSTWDECFPLTKPLRSGARSQEPFGLTSRGVDDCTRPASLEWDHMDNLSPVSESAGCSSQCVSQLAQVAPLVSPMFPRGCGLESITRVILGTWMDAKDLLFQLAQAPIWASPVTGKPPRDLLPIPFYPASEVWEPASANKEGTRLRKVPASSDLYGWLLLVITGLNWLDSVKPESVFVGPPSKVQTKALSLLAGEVSQFFHQCGGVLSWRKWTGIRNSKLVPSVTTGLGGLMGVAKAGDDRNTGPQHLIMNIRVSNWAQNIIAGDMPQLPTSGQWRYLILKEEETLIWSGEDLKCCFHVFEIPKPWRRWVAFAKLVSRNCFVPGSSGQVYLCSKVVPMGWVSATGVIQHGHHRLLTSPLQHLRCLEPAAEVRRHWPLPAEGSRTTSSLEFVCPTRGAALGPDELHVGRGSADSVWAPSVWCNPFRVSEVGSAARAVWRVADFPRGICCVK